MTSGPLKLIAAALFLACGSTALGQASLRSLELVPFESSYGRAVSGDGAVVVGYTYTRPSGAVVPTRATRCGYVENIGTTPPPTTSVATAVNGDGSVVVGNMSVTPFYHATRWTRETGTVSLGEPTQLGYGVSADGSVIVGQAYSSGSRAFRWTAAGGAVSLGTVLSDAASCALAVSGNGAVVVGWSGGTGDSDFKQAFRWDSEAGMHSLGFLPGTGRSVARGISRDGSVIVGECGTINVGTAFQWTGSGGMIPLLMPPGADASWAYCTNHDGSVIGGSAYLPEFGGYYPLHAFVWVAGQGPIDLNTYLPSHGADLTGWNIAEVYGMSADGLTVTGLGDHGGRLTAWVATLAPRCGPADFDHDGSPGTDADVEAFFACIAGNCCPTCDPLGADFNGDCDTATDADIEAFVRVLAGGTC